MNYLTIAKDVVQIAFWLLAGILAILTYRQARRTVLQPIRTEVFKEQLKIMSEAMSRFTGKHEVALRDDFDFRALFDANACYLLDSYVASVFDKRFDPDQRLYNQRACPMKIVPIDAIAKPSKPQVDSSKPPVDVAYSQVWTGDWRDYSAGKLYINKQCVEMSESVKRLLENPLLPLKLAELLSEYLALVVKNQFVLLKLLDRAAIELPERFPSLQAIDHVVWSRELWSAYMGEFNHLKPLADEIVKFVRGYFEADNLKRL